MAFNTTNQTYCKLFPDTSFFCSLPTPQPHFPSHFPPPCTHLSLHVRSNPCIQQLLNNVIVSLCRSQVQGPCIVLHTQVDLATGSDELMNHVGVPIPDREVEGSPAVLGEGQGRGRGGVDTQVRGMR